MSKVIQSMFYNANYNLGYPDGQSKFIWGVQEIDFSKDIQKQLLGAQEVFNFNLTSLNPIFDPCHDENNLVEENQRLTAIAAKHEARADNLYEILKVILDDLDSYGGVLTNNRIKAKEILDKSRTESDGK